MIIAVIPARGGSKRIPRKNIKNFCGKPIIAYSIEAAINSKCFDQVIVSTDDDEIANIAKSYGAEVPFMRPEDLSDDITGTNDVVKHVIEALNTEVEYACCIYATAPFVESRIIREGYNKLKDDLSADFAVTVTNFSFPIQRALALSKNNKLAMREPENLSTRSQDLNEMYHDAGQIYWGRRDSFLKKKSLFDNKTIPISLPIYCVQDIDVEDDWYRAELMYRAYINQDINI